MVEKYGDLKNEIISIQKEEKIKLIEGASLGSFGTPPPRPTDVFENISLFSDELKTNQIYKQEPIFDSLWIRTLIRLQFDEYALEFTK